MNKPTTAIFVTNLVLFIILDEPLFVESSPVRVASDVGSSAVLVCKIAAYPPPSVTWSGGLDNSAILADGKRYETNLTQLEGDLYQAILKINNVKKTDYTNYNCLAMNSLGENKLKMSLEPKGPPEAPSAPYSVAFDRHWVLLGWKEGFDGGYRNTGFIVTRKAQGSSGEQQVDCRMKNPCNITNLDDETYYEFKVSFHP